MAEIARAPFAEACWYLAATREQFRLAGALAVVGPGCGDAPLAAARARAWGNLSDAARAQFSWPQPGLPLPEEGGAEAEGGAADGDAAAPGGEAAAAAPQPGAAPPLDTFCLLVLSVSRVDWLRLRGNQRSVFERRGGGGGAEGWTTQAVTP